MSFSVHLGAMNFGKRTSEKEARAIIHRALERGVGLIDTANAYADGVSERIVGEALSALAGSSRPRVATKVGWMKVSGKYEGLSKARVLAAAEESLARLGTDAIDLYYLHQPDDAVPIEETLDALAELFRAKKILGWAVSNYASWQILEMLGKAESRGLPRPEISQVLYNLLIRQIEIEHLRFLERYGIACAAYNPLAGGLLTDLYGPEGALEKTHRFHKNEMYRRRYLSPRMLSFASELRSVAREAGLSLVTFAYAWLRARRGVSAVVVGPGTIDHLDEALDALEMELDPALVERADALHTEYLGTEAVYARS